MNSDNSDDEEVSLCDVKETNPVEETAKEVADYATKSDNNEDFTNRLADSQVNNIKCIFRDAPEGGNMESMIDIIQEDDYDPASTERVFAKTIWSPVVQAAFSYLHACGPDPAKRESKGCRRRHSR